MGIYTKVRDYFRNIIYLKKYKNAYNYNQRKKSSSVNNKFTFPSENKITVSIIIPFYNQIDYTIDCLKSINENLPSKNIEIILVDDNSSENTDILSIENIIILRNIQNIGFLNSVNRGIKQSRGEYIYLLNNDTIVHSGFLDELLFVFENFKDVGAVGSMLLNQDGTLQESGAYFLNDGHPTQIANKPIYAPEINYIRQVDYCSGCSLLFKRKQDSGDLNLFDTHFAPAYYEDADLCFQIRHIQNKKIYYTPFSKITHFNGASYNNNSNTTKGRLLEKNYSTFSLKWQKVLSQIKSESKWERIQELYNEKHIIFFHSRIPQPDNNSGELRLFEIMKTYSSLGYHCSIICEENTIKNKYNETLQRIGIRTYYDYMPFLNNFYFIRRLKKYNHILWFSTSDIFLNYHKLSKKYFPNAKFIFDMVDIHHLRYQRALEFDPKNKKYKRRYKRYYKYELLSSELADLIVAISDDEKDYMTKFVDASKVTVISNVHYFKVDLNQIPSFENRKDLLFIGSSHHPNIDAINYLKDEIMPEIWKHNPDIKLNIIGDVISHYQGFRHDNINFLGFVPDITTNFLNSKIMIAPLRYGAGVKGKIGQAFEYYLPVVTSSIGGEGMYLTHNKNALLADDGKDFATQILRLYSNKNLWEELQQNMGDSLSPFSIQNLENRILQIANNEM
jgi:GT2 family glycosyltransferase